ncbi:MFS transporter [Actinomadura sp. PM05-2]|uniref:MFS transporter n=2 Tax=Actinomadura parmotrematis TaxID=2864039 RepID=A0ABS7FV31_9ACTN|nr:MFS transporter [Actinomadura parmotrematis]
MSHGRILRALSGLYLGMFVAIVSSTIVTNALPRIITDLRTGQSTYTWVIVSTLLATTVSSPLWGKLADLVSKKALVQLGLLIFAAGSLLSGLATDPATLIAARTVQGAGAGGLLSLTQVIMATMISPRERGRYSGYMGAVLAVGTAGGPLVGGVIVDTRGLGWRWCFFVVVPLALIAMAVLQRNLDLPVRRRKVTVDWAGAALITSAASLLLVWVTFAGDDYAWLSWWSAAMVGGGTLLAVLFVLVETRAAEPIVPLRLFRNRTVALAVVASLLAGVAMYASTTFLSQYFQLSRGQSPTAAGILTLPLILSLAVASAAGGRIITRTGRWKPFLVGGAVLLAVGCALLGLLRHGTPYGVTAAGMACLGVGLGLTLQNLVLAVQNQVRPQELGAASTAVAFFRTLGGTVGVSALGAVLANRVTRYAEPGLARLGVRHAPSSDALPDLGALPAPVRAVVEDAFGHATGSLFLYTVPFALLSVVAILCIKEVPLRTSSALQAAGAAGTGGPEGDGRDHGADLGRPHGA